MCCARDRCSTGATEGGQPCQQVGRGRQAMPPSPAHQLHNQPHMSVIPCSLWDHSLELAAPHWCAPGAWPYMQACTCASTWLSTPDPAHIGAPAQTHPHGAVCTCCSLDLSAQVPTDTHPKYCALLLLSGTPCPAILRPPSPGVRAPAA